MRIAIVTSYPPSRGSLNEYAYHFVAQLQEKADVTAIHLIADELDAPQAELPHADHVRLERAWQFGATDNALRIRRAIAAACPDAVLFNIQFASFADSRVAGALGLLAPLLVKQLDMPTIVLLHNIMETIDLGKAGFGGNALMERLTRLAGNLFTRVLLRADMVALTIPKYVEILEAKYGAKNVFLAPHGAFEAPPEPDFALPTGPFQIMTFGKFGTYKRIEVLLEAFALLQQQVSTPLELVIAGGDSPNAGGYIDGVRQRYAHIANVRYTGYVPEGEVARIFGEAGVVIFPYNSTTGSSGVLHQAGSYGKAVVLPRLGDFVELIEEEGYRGEYFTPEDPVTLAAAIRTFIEHPEHRHTIGLTNYRASVGLPMSDVVDWYLLHFHTLMQAKQGKG